MHKLSTRYCNHWRHVNLHDIHVYIPFFPGYAHVYLLVQVQKNLYTTGYATIILFLAPLELAITRRHSLYQLHLVQLLSKAGWRRAARGVCSIRHLQHPELRCKGKVHNVPHPLLALFILYVVVIKIM